MTPADDQFHPDLRRAAEEAYARARREVYDLEVDRPGAPRTPEQLEVLADLERAERALRDAREHRYRLHQDSAGDTT